MRWLRGDAYPSAIRKDLAGEPAFAGRHDPEGRDDGFGRTRRCRAGLADRRRVLGSCCLGLSARPWCRGKSLLQKTRPGDAAGVAAPSNIATFSPRTGRSVCGTVEHGNAAPLISAQGPHWGITLVYSDPAVTLPRSTLAARRVMFHMKSDSAMLDNIAVLRGSASSDCLFATRCIRLPLLRGAHTQVQCPTLLTYGNIYAKFVLM